MCQQYCRILLDINESQTIALCARYGSFAKSEREMCDYCPFYEPNQSRNI